LIVHASPFDAAENSAEFAQAFLQPKYLESCFERIAGLRTDNPHALSPRQFSLAALRPSHRLTSALLAQAKRGKNRCDDADEPVDKLLATSLGDYCPKLPKIAKNDKNDHHLRSRR
jgi:hypothetical protein